MNLLEDLDQLLSNESIGLKELYTVFEESKSEMVTLQTISFERFKSETQLQNMTRIGQANTISVTITP